MPRIRANGVMMHYQQGGDGPDVLMVHGLYSSLAFWYFSVYRYLVSHFRLTMYDLRGHGLSDMPSSGYTCHDLAADLLALLDALGVNRAHVIGHSFGASVALSAPSLLPNACSRSYSLMPAFARWSALFPRVTR